MDLCKTELCTGCAACANSCPKQCIQMIADTEGFLRPQVDAEQCVSCGACQKACPILNSVPHGQETVAYAAICKDESIRKESTSGGVFTLLAQWVLKRGGAVFGAAYTDDFSVEHRCVQSVRELSSFRSAKYAQSRIGKTYQTAKQLLNEGRYVLFSGTSCQIAGLTAYLRKKYDKLILVDVICHGVPSPSVWQRYIQYRSKTDAQGVVPAAINLRSKETGWPGYSVRFEYGNGVHYSARNLEDPYLRSFVGNLCLRPSCYDCQFKSVSRCSDFTLGDYWGVWNQLPEYNDGKGTSLVLLHSEKAHILWNELQDQMQCCQVPLPKCLEENVSALYSSTFPERRAEFIARCVDEDFQVLTQELLPQAAIKIEQPSFMSRMAGKLKRLISPKSS